jgi:hypothetical protein
LCAATKKKSSEVYRVEVEFHTAWLRGHRIASVKDLARLPELVPRKELRFVRINIEALERLLRRRGLPIDSNLWRAKELPSGLPRELLRLRALGLANTHRLVIGLKTNERVEQALKNWAEDWLSEDDG